MVAEASRALLVRERTNALSVVPASVASADSLALEVFSDMRKLPDRFIVHAATNDHNAPLICRGDIVVVDTGGAHITGGWYPTEGGLFLIEHGSMRLPSERYIRRSWSIVQTFTDDRGMWWTGALRRGVHGRQIICSDGPYNDELTLADKLIGSVVGLYRPQHMEAA